MLPESLDALAQRAMFRRAQGHQLRRRRSVVPVDATHVLWAGRLCVNFSSNNYLGLTHHPGVLAAAAEGLQRCGAGAAASPLISGWTEEHAATEAAIAQWKRVAQSLLFPSGYQAAHAVVQTIRAVAAAPGPGVRFLLDKLCHASLIDAVAGSGALFRVFPHNHLAKLRRLLEDPDDGRHQVVITESIFSMDGDSVDLRGIVELKQLRPFTLVLDEAHASGVYGPSGAGYAAECGLQSAVDVSIVTLSKALSLCGGAVCASAHFCEAVANFGRAYIYSTSVPPSACAAVRAAIRVMADEPQRQLRVRSLAGRVRAQLRRLGVQVPAGDSPIIPVILGEESRAVDAARRLVEKGLLVMAIRPPTVPRGASRLRVTLSSEHSDAEIANLLEALEQILK